MLNAILGRGKVQVYGALAESKEGGVPRALIAIMYRVAWFLKKRILMDPISFLLIAEKAAQHKGGEFVYNEMHDDVRVTLTLPAWAMDSFIEECGKTAPIVYDTLKKASENRTGLLEQGKALGIPEKELAFLKDDSESPIVRYRKLHAKLNGYDVTHYVDTGDRTIN